ncbi:MarR family transcriptional regulator [Rhodobacteraceae bacterium HSP-20]|uniref:MarR family transcriptional regulator n=1 Tax=Paragemmobacter amnigenus TaxID=2852097 RepID=A0ABS6IZT5_9RHOB|nr:MarR family transcriptional regulator [Rhodobacter amnigenus]MBU9697009.1 MarR family transcriptional regulator [Rhodobacter amnigenus]MBV4388236.1 MarR family transcriptional regulator [Rhodobacter amnigenus]
MGKATAYLLDEQIGYLLRRATQRHLAIFSARIPRVTTTQWAVLARLMELGPLSQNLLGRETAMDAATVKGVVDRLAREGLVATAPDPSDRRRLIVGLTGEGRAFCEEALASAARVSDETLAPLGPEERRVLLDLLARLV